MAKKEKACKKCRAVFEGQKCPACGSVEFTDSFKGKVFILKRIEPVLVVAQTVQLPIGPVSTAT